MSGDYERGLADGLDMAYWLVRGEAVENDKRANDPTSSEPERRWWMIRRASAEDSARRIKDLQTQRGLTKSTV